jgi:hypothetical protein
MPRPQRGFVSGRRGEPFMPVMPDHSQRYLNSALLQCLPPSSLRKIEPYLEEVELHHNAVLFDVDDPLHTVVFPARRAMVC